MYEVLLFVHIACAIIWVGGAIYAQLISLQFAEPADRPRLGRAFEHIGTRVFVPASVLLFIAGLAMTAQRWSFSDLWINVSMLLWLVSLLAGALYLGPRLKRAAALFESEGPSSVAAIALSDRILLVSRLELLSFAIIVALMVFKPAV